MNVSKYLATQWLVIDAGEKFYKMKTSTIMNHTMDPKKGHYPLLNPQYTIESSISPVNSISRIHFPQTPGPLLCSLTHKTYLPFYLIKKQKSSEDSFPNFQSPNPKTHLYLYSSPPLFFMLHWERHSLTCALETPFRQKPWMIIHSLPDTSHPTGSISSAFTPSLLTTEGEKVLPDAITPWTYGPQSSPIKSTSEEVSVHSPMYLGFYL